jgi:hypothetical protein
MKVPNFRIMGCDGCIYYNEYTVFCNTYNIQVLGFNVCDTYEARVLII